MNVNSSDMIRSNLHTPIDDEINSTTNKYLVNPFLKEINSPEFAVSKNEMKLIVGTTGLGKTHAVFHYYIPELFDNHQLDLIMYSFPMTEIYDREDAQHAQAWTRGMVLTEDITEAKELLKAERFKVLLCKTHCALVVDQKGKDFLKWLIESGKTAGWFVDEPHTWMASGAFASDEDWTTRRDETRSKWDDNYEEVIGSSAVDYNATLYRATEAFAIRSPYLFGTTATPQSEQRGLVDVVGNLNYRIINEYPNLIDMMPRSAWLGIEHHYEIGQNGTLEGTETQETFFKALSRHLDKSEKYGKMSMIIKTGRSNDAFNWSRDSGVMPLIKKFIENHRPEYQNGDLRFCYMAQGGEKGFMSYNWSNHIGATESEMKKALADPDDPCQFLLVIEKGRMGMNIANLGTYFSFRKADKSASHGPILESALQEVGRLQRFWTGIPKDKFVAEYGYDMTRYIQHLPESEIAALFVRNSYDVYVPNNRMWRGALKFLKLQLSPTVEDAKAWVAQIRGLRSV